MNVLLIYPEFPDTFWSYKYALKFIRKKAAFPPLGLLTVAAMLPGNWAKRLIDINVTKLTDKELQWADIVFISAMAVQRLMAFFRTSVRLGVISKERFQYWRLVSWTLRNRPELLPLAITFAIYGHHFRRICESNIL